MDSSVINGETTNEYLWCSVQNKKHTEDPIIFEGAFMFEALFQM